MKKLLEHKFTIALSVAALAILSGGGYWAWSHSPPPMPETIEEAEALVKTARFQNLSKDEKRIYNERFLEMFGTLDRDKRRELMATREMRDAGRDAFRQRMLDRAREFAMADPAQQDAMLAEDMARMAQWRGQRGPRPERTPEDQLTEEQKQEREQRRQDRQNRMEDWINEGNGQDNNLMREYWRRFREYRQRQQG